MSEPWKPKAEQCLIDKKKLDDVYLAVVGDRSLGVPGLVNDVKAVKDSADNLTEQTHKIQRTLENGMLMTQAGTWIGKALVGASFLACAVIAILDYMSKK